MAKQQIINKEKNQSYNNNFDKFLLEFKNLLKLTTCCYADIIDKIAELEKKFPDKYKEFTEFQMNPTNIFDFLDKIEEKNPEDVFALIGLMKLMLKVATLEQRFRNIIHLPLKEKTKLSGELRTIIDDINGEMKKLKIM